jgi:hypothetical protein
MDGAAINGCIGETVPLAIADAEAAIWLVRARAG